MYAKKWGIQEAVQLSHELMRKTSYIAESMLLDMHKDEAVTDRIVEDLCENLAIVCYLLM